MNSKIIFTGGGSAGHVTPNLALIKKFLDEGWKIHYIGSANGIEKEIISQTKIPFYSIACGKLRRYFSWKTFLEPFKILQGIIESFILCRKIKPRAVFSKGGFVAFPVVVGAWLNRIPVFVHESDLTPGLANKLSYSFAQKICLTFPDSQQYFKNKSRLHVTGTPIRSELLRGDSAAGLKNCHFNADKKIILVIGGSLGAETLNETIRTLLPSLLLNYQIIHLCGKGKLDSTLKDTQGYIQFEYLTHELSDVMACSDLVISRAGANSIYELIGLRKPHILVPLSKKASRGDQIINAKYFQQKNLSQVILEENLTHEILLEKIHWVDQHIEEIKKQLNTFEIHDSVQLIYDLILSTFKGEKNACVNC